MLKCPVCKKEAPLFGAKLECISCIMAQRDRLTDEALQTRTR